MPKPSDPEKRKFMFTDDIKFLQKAIVLHPNDNSLFLALKRSPNDFARPNDWDLSGGNVLYGIKHDESLRNEIMEESGVEVDKLTPTQVITNYDEKKKIYYIFIGFSCVAGTEEVTLSDEHVEYKWVTKKEFNKLAKAQYLKDLAEMVL